MECAGFSAFAQRLAPGPIDSPGIMGKEAKMDALVETLDAKLREWKPETVTEVREKVAEIIALADQDALDLLRSRGIEQEVLDAIDGHAAR